MPQWQKSSRNSAEEPPAVAEIVKSCPEDDKSDRCFPLHRDLPMECGYIAPVRKDMSLYWVSLQTTANYTHVLDPLYNT